MPKKIVFNYAGISAKKYLVTYLQWTMKMDGTVTTTFFVTYSI